MRVQNRTKPLTPNQIQSKHKAVAPHVHRRKQRTHPHRHAHTHRHTDTDTGTHPQTHTHGRNCAAVCTYFVRASKAPSETSCPWHAGRAATTARHERPTFWGGRIRARSKWQTPERNKAAPLM